VLTGSRAGHVPAVWATADGRSGIDLPSGGVPVGILPGETYPVTRRRLTEAGAYVLLTDGVVEGPSFPIEAGLERVVQLVCSGCDADPDDLAAEVIKVADLTGHKDDAAVLVLRHDGAPSPQ
jgi:serine phosphatase RsbU (regulator of sigma subunit)